MRAQINRSCARSLCTSIPTFFAWGVHICPPPDPLILPTEALVTFFLLAPACFSVVFRLPSVSGSILLLSPRRRTCSRPSIPTPPSILVQVCVVFKHPCGLNWPSHISKSENAFSVSVFLSVSFFSFQSYQTARAWWDKTRSVILEKKLTSTSQAVPLYRATFVFVGSFI